MVHATTVDGLKGGRLRVGMVGGGRNAFIGAVHRMAMRLDDLIELKAGALSSDAENARASGADLGLAPDRTYSNYCEMAAREAARPDGIEAVVIVTPNHLHFPVAKAFLEAGIDVICDKPLSTTLAEASELVELTRTKGLVFAVTLNNTGYPMVRQAREMIEAGELGDIRVVHAAYVQDWLTLPIDADGHKQAVWRTDPTRAGASACLADIGVHAHSLALFVTGLELDAVSAELTTFVPGRRLDDNAHVLLRFQGGARGVLAASQVAVGNLNNLSIKVYGSRAGLEWAGEEPETLRFTPYGEPSRILRRGGPGNTSLAIEGSRMPGGHPESYVEGFANLYRGAAELISARRTGRTPEKSANLTPNVVDGARGVAFIEAAVQSSQNDGAWTFARFGERTTQMRYTALHMLIGRKQMKLTGILGSASLAVLAMAGNAHAADKYVVGVSNTLIGNGWREEMICSIKAEAEASGKVSKVVVANRNGGPSEQIADIRNLISAGANIIIINPSDREALNPVIKQAADKGIVVVAVDQAVSAPEAYVLTNDQVEYAKLGAKWLFDKLGGRGSVVEMRGIDGVPADADRHQGFTETAKNYPDIKVTSVFSGWALDKTAQATKNLLASGKPIDGVWTSGIDSTVVDAYKTAGKPYVPVVGADNNGFIGQLIDQKDKGLSGAAVSNPPAVGAAGLSLALDILAKKDHPRVVKVTPTVWDNGEGLSQLKAAYDPKLDPYFSVATVPPYTHYTPEQLISCKGP